MDPSHRESMNVPYGRHLAVGDTIGFYLGYDSWCGTVVDIYRYGQFGDEVFTQWRRFRVGLHESSRTVNTSCHAEHCQ